MTATTAEALDVALANGTPAPLPPPAEYAASHAPYATLAKPQPWGAPGVRARAQGAALGGLVGDAAACGVQWVYDLKEVDRLAEGEWGLSRLCVGRGVLLRPPPRALVVPTPVTRGGGPRGPRVLRPPLCPLLQRRRLPPRPRLLLRPADPAPAGLAGCRGGPGRLRLCRRHVCRAGRRVCGLPRRLHARLSALPRRGQAAARDGGGRRPGQRVHVREGKGGGVGA